MTVTSANPALRRRTVVGTAIALFGLAGGARAFAGPAPADLQVVDRDTGQTLRLWPASGRLYIAGEPGHRYALRVTNRTGGRVMAVLSVDGVNVVTGETASYDQNGYVLHPYESYDVTGWRKSQAEVAAFAFAPLSQSYAARTGRPGDVGVIGMAVFREKAPEPPPPPPPPPPPVMIQPQPRDGLDRGASAAPGRGSQGKAAADAAPSSVTDLVVTAERRSARAGAPAAPIAAPPPLAISRPSAAQPPATARAYGGLEREDERLGTAHGAREASYVNLTNFERATAYPECIRRIEYDTYAHLVAGGVIPRPWRPPTRPRPFPQDPDGAGFVPDPPG